MNLMRSLIEHLKLSYCVLQDCLVSQCGSYAPKNSLIVTA